MKRNLFIIAALVLMTSTGCGSLPDPPVTTVWQKLGIPQGLIGLRDGLVNRKGNFPGLERKPPLLPLAAPENLESPIEMIKVAAQVKAAEDLAPQKIKALKYLGAVGCGCYDKDGAIEAALLEALADCTPDVRIAAAEAIQEATGDCACVDGCAMTCCTEAIQEKLAEIAYGEENGCWIEPNAEVREAALAALSSCPPIVDDPIINREGVDPEIDPERSGDSSGAAPPVPGTAGSVEFNTSDAILFDSSSNDEIPVISGDESYYEDSQVQTVSIDDPELQAALEALVPSVHVEPEFVAEEASNEDAAGLIPARIESLDDGNGIVQIAFFDSYEIPVGTSLVLVNDGQEVDVVITETSVGQATAGITRMIDGARDSLSVGEVVKVGILAE